MEKIVQTSPKAESELAFTTQVDQEYQQAVRFGLLIVEGWLKKRYNLQPGAFSQLQVQIMNTVGQNYYYPAQMVAEVRVSSIRLYLYDICHAGKTTRPEGMPVGVGAYIVLSLLHELTHHVQNILKKSFSEMETTVNQLDFMEQFYPLEFSQLIQATDKQEEPERTEGHRV